MQGELNELPRQRKIDIDTIPERVRTFIRNPPSARSRSISSTASRSSRAPEIAGSYED
jgi:hypothetical protein